MSQMNTTIAGGQVRLRLLTEDDLPMTLAWRNRDEVRRWFRQSAAIDLAKHTAWFRQLQLADDALVFIVEDNNNGEAVGQVSIYHIDRETGEAEVGRFIVAPGASGKGFIRAAIIALSQFAFHELALARLYLEVIGNNERAIRLYASVGFEVFVSPVAPQPTDERLVMMEMKKPS